MSRTPRDHQNVAETNASGADLKVGTVLLDWPVDVHPYGKPDPCPFCRVPLSFTALRYRGPGSPPSYNVSCGYCAALGPASSGAGPGDHWGARVDAVRQWNRCSPRRLPLRLHLRRRLARLLNQISHWLMES